MADAALAADAPEMALRIADLVLEEQPSNVPALIARGDALYAMSQRDSAQEAYRRAIALDQEAVGAQIGLGRTLAHSDPRAAESAFLIALAHDPDNVVALNNLGVVQDLQGRETEAQESYQRALIIAPASTDVRINLGMSLALSGHLDEAVQELRATAATPDGMQKWREELIAGLTLAGDAAWAKQMLPPDRSEVPKDPVNPVKADRLALAMTPSPIIPRVSERAPRVAAITLPANGGSYGESPRKGTVRPSTAPSLVAEMPSSIEVPAPNVAPLISIISSDLPPIGSPSDALPAATQRVVTAFNKLATHSTFGTHPTMAPDDIDAARSAPSPAEVRGQIAAWIAAHEPAVTPLVSTTESDAFVQVASLLSESDALFEWHRVSKRLAGILPGREPTITPAEARGRIYWRLRTFGFADINEANNLCGQIKASGFGCWTGRGL